MKLFHGLVISIGNVIITMLIDLNLTPYLTPKREIKRFYEDREILFQGHRDPPKGFKMNEMSFQANLIMSLVLTGLFDTENELN